VLSVVFSPVVAESRLGEVRERQPLAPLVAPRGPGIGLGALARIHGQRGELHDLFELEHRAGIFALVHVEQAALEVRLDDVLAHRGQRGLRRGRARGGHSAGEQERHAKRHAERRCDPGAADERRCVLGHQ
jgi:hypothetical protein